MEKWMGSLLFGAAGFMFAAYVLLSDSRRMGFAMPGDNGKTATGRGGAGGRRRAGLLWALALAFLAVPVCRKPCLVGLLIAIAARAVKSYRSKKRQAEISGEWPFLIEGMAVAALSGLDAGAAFQSAVRRMKGPLRQEADKVVLRLMGGSSLSRALSSMDEAALPDVRRLKTVLSQSEILGTPIAGMLKGLADEGYDAERQEMEERFNALPLKLSAITVFFLLPPVLAVSVIPHILAFLEARW